MWWSRPSPWAMGVRPNSPPQTTSVSSSMPRCLRSLIRAAEAWSTSLALTGMSRFSAAVHVPVAMVELDEPHAALGQPPGQQAVGRERAVVARGAVQVEDAAWAPWTRSISSGTLVCMRKAISYWAMRVAISGSSTVSCRSLFSALTASITSRCRAAVDARRVAQVVDRVAARLELHALVAAGQEAAVPLPRWRSAAIWPPRPVEMQHDEARQVLALAPQAVEHPRAHRRAGRRSSCRCS